MDNFTAKKSILNNAGFRGARLFQGISSQQLTLNFQWQKPLLVFTLWRLFLGILPFIALLFPNDVFHGGTAPYTLPSYYLDTTDFWTDRLLAVWGRWDGEWYLQIINFGYTPPEATPAFFPFYPFLVKVTGDLGHFSYLLAGVVVSGLASSVVFILFYNLTLRDFKDKKLAGNTLFMLLIFPTVFFLSAIYTEALFMVLSLAAFYCVRHLTFSSKWWLAGLLIALATLTRNIGILIVVPLAWEWWQENHQAGQIIGFKPESYRKLAGFIVPPGVALAGWMVMLWLGFGNPLIFVSAQSSRYWERHSALPWETLWQAVTQLFSTKTFSDSNLIDFLAFISWTGLVTAGIYLVRKRNYPFSYLIFLILAFIPGLTEPRPAEALFGIPRFLMVLFPAYQILALALPRNRWFRVAYGLFSGGTLIYLTIHFVQWGWVA